MATLAPIRPGQLFRGRDTVLTFTVADVNMTTWALRWTLRRSPLESGSALVSLTTPGDIDIPSATVAEVTVPAADTLVLFPGTYCHLFERTDSGASTVLSYGWVVLEP